MIKYIKELDGLRGVAVMLVAAFHIVKRAIYFTENEVLHVIPTLTGVGWIGVDIFFVLSGFLITSILLSTKNDESYFKNFYSRRALRIFPLYYFAVGVILLFAPRINAEFTNNINYALPIMLLYQQNWLLFFGVTWIPQYLGITWSLAIEEQFYLIWPFIVRKLTKEKLLKFSLIYIFLSWSTRIVITFFFKDLAADIHFYYSSFSRFEELLWGGLLAISISYDGVLEKLRKFAVPMFIVPFTLFAILCLFSWPDTPQPDRSNLFIAMSGYTLVSWFTVGLLSIFITQPSQNLLRQFFQNNILVFLGKYSYSIYLFHIVVTVILLDEFWLRNFRGWEFFFIHIILSFTITIIIAVLTWHLLEKHMLKLKKYFEYHPADDK
jgi:peptidoglycan/LPS O-acetylase OafA/YrhL